MKHIFDIIRDGGIETKETNETKEQPIEVPDFTSIRDIIREVPQDADDDILAEAERIDIPEIPPEAPTANFEDSSQESRSILEENQALYEKALRDVMG